jgi:hypothetical protein
MSTFRLANDPDLLPAMIKPVPVQHLIEEHPDMLPVVIEGILRRGETMNVIAAAKVGKSFLVGNLAWCVATGRPWLSHDVAQGRVLVVDNELHPQTLANRLDAIANAMMIGMDERNMFDAVTVRGMGIDIHGIGARLDIEPGKYALVILDALYRLLPEGVSENDNAEMMHIYNKLDEYAKTWDCGIVVVHHASKGQQGDKEITDVGAGAGSISRAADTHLTIRPHEQFGLHVLDARCRSFVSPEPVSVQYEYPLWNAVATEAKVRIPKGQGDAKQSKNDAEADQAVSMHIQDKWLSISELRTKTGFGPDRIARSLGRIGAASKWMKSEHSGKSSERFSLMDEAMEQVASGDQKEGDKQEVNEVEWEVERTKNTRSIGQL